MKRILFFICFFLVITSGFSQTTIYGEGSRLFYVITSEGYYQIQASEVKIGSTSQTFTNPRYIPVKPPLDKDGTPMPTGRMTCAQGKLYASNQKGGFAECGPTRGVTGSDNSITYTCFNQDQWLCKLETFNAAGDPVTYWGWEFK